MDDSVAIGVTGLIAAGAKGTLVNQAMVAPLDGLVDPTPIDAIATDTDTLLVSSGMMFTKKAASPRVELGKSMVYEITVTNRGPSLATGISFLDAMPTELRFDRIIDSVGWACLTAAISVMTCALDEALPVGASATFHVEATPLAVGKVRNVAVLNSFGPPSNSNSAPFRRWPTSRSAPKPSYPYREPVRRASALPSGHCSWRGSE